MAGYCTTCGGSGYRRPSRENKRADFVDEIARLALYDATYQAEEGCETVNDLILRARRLTKKG